MRKAQGGFTLIELVVVIVLLGILGVTALGRFQDLSTDASRAAASGVASELSASAAINYARAIAGGTPDVTINATAGAAVTVDGTANACDTSGTALGLLFQTGTFPAPFTTVANTAPNCTAVGVTYECTIYNDLDGSGTLNGTEPSATATLICTG